MSIHGLKKHCIEKIRLKRLHTLKREEDVLKKLIKKYEDSLNGFQIEELNIKHQLSKMRARDIESPTNLSQDTASLHSVKPMEHSNITKGGLNVAPRNIEAAPLIQRMLKDSMTFDEEDLDT